MTRYAITIFLSAFLLFQVQPIIGKFILPWFGGSPAVWTTCLLFFQVFLLAGYAYAHLVSGWLRPRALVALHVVLLAGSLALLPIAPDAAVWKQSADDVPIVQILALLGATIGLPYFLLASTGPLLQEGFRRETGHTPYRLYALSNAGSLLALLSYPFMFEPRLALRTQIVGWSWFYALFAALCAWCTLGFLRAARPEPTAARTTASTASDAKPEWGDVLFWLALAACGSTMLLATTNQLCQEIPSVPFMWVLPLALYLTTFIICFDRERWYRRSVFLFLLAAAVVGASYALFQGTLMPMGQQLAIYSGTLFVSCMICHGELARAKPDARHATLFYWIVSAGGAAGGVFVAIVAPLVFPDFWEYHVALVGTVLLAVLATNRDWGRSGGWPMPRWMAGGGISLAIGLTIGWAMTMYQSVGGLNERKLETTRNFYGVLRVNYEENVGSENGPLHELVHGRIRHGYQYLDPDKKRMPTTYYGRPSGVGLALDCHPRRVQSDHTLRIGIVGLGCGTLAAFGRPGDTIRYYEINPEVARIANEYFTYCKDSEATVEVVLGDARIRMEQELAAGEPQRFDVLAIDAFSSDAIPMHLLTRECVEIYRQHLKPDGLLCLHLSNKFLDLDGVARGVAEILGSECVRIDSPEDKLEGLDSATWMIVTSNREFLDAPEVRDAVQPWTDKDMPPMIWTDDYGSLWQTLRL